MRYALTIVLALVSVGSFQLGDEAPARAGLARYGSAAAAPASRFEVLSEQAEQLSVSRSGGAAPLLVWQHNSGQSATAVRFAGGRWQPGSEIPAGGRVDRGWESRAVRLRDGTLIVAWVNSSPQATLVVAERRGTEPWAVTRFVLRSSNPAYFHRANIYLQVTPEIVELPGGAVLVGVIHTRHPGRTGNAWGSNYAETTATVVERSRTGAWRLRPNIRGVPRATRDGATAIWGENRAVYVARWRIGRQPVPHRIPGRGYVLTTAVSPDGTVAAAVARRDRDGTMLVVQTPDGAYSATPMRRVYESYLGPPVIVARPGQIVAAWEGEGVNVHVATWSRARGFKMTDLGGTGTGSCLCDDPILVVAPDRSFLFWSPYDDGADGRYLAATTISPSGNVSKPFRVTATGAGSRESMRCCAVATDGRGVVDVVWTVSPPGAAVGKSVRGTFFARRWTSGAGWSRTRAIHRGFTSSGNALIGLEHVLNAGAGMGVIVLESGTVLVRSRSHEWSQARLEPYLQPGERVDDFASSVDAVAVTAKTLVIVVRTTQDRVLAALVQP